MGNFNTDLLDINKLQLDDLVYYKEKNDTYIATITGLFKGPDYAKCIIKYTDANGETVQRDTTDIEGVPITKDYLIKNGFTKYSENVFEKWPFDIINFNDSGESKLWRVHYRDSEEPFAHVYYVHEIQHLLKTNKLACSLIKQLRKQL